MNRQTLSLIGILILVLALAAPSFAVFTDDFEDPAWTVDNWWWWSPKITHTSDGGDGILNEHGAYGGNHNAEAITVAAKGCRYAVDNLTISADIRVVEGEHAGLYLGSRGVIPGSGGGLTYGVYYVGIVPPLGVGLNELTADGDEPLAEVYTPVSYNTWYRLEFVSTATNFEVWLAPRGEALVKIIDVPQDALHPGWQAIESGLVGTYAHTDTIADFDNVSVQGDPLPERTLGCPLVQALRERPTNSAGVWLSDAAGVAGLQFDLYYDPALLTGLQLEKGPVIAADPNWSLRCSTLAPGHVRCLAYNTASEALPAGTHGEMVTLAFTLPLGATFDHESILDLDAPILCDRLGSPLPAACYDGLVRVARSAQNFAFDAVPSPQCVGNPFEVTLHAIDPYGDPGVLFNGGANLSDLTGTMTPTYVTFTEGLATWSATIGAAHAADEIRAADALDSAVVGTSNAFQVLAISDPNGDGETNVLDVLLAVNYALEILEPTPAQLAAADPNHDGAVNVLDVILIQNLALGITGSPPPARNASLQAVQAGRKTVHGAKTMAVPILIDDAAGLAGAQFSLAYDASAYTPVEVRAGDLLSGNSDWIVSANLSGTPAKVLCFSSTATPLPAGKGTLAEVVFAQTGKAPRPAVSLQAAVCGDGAGGRIACGLSAGKAHPVR